MWTNRMDPFFDGPEENGPEDNGSEFDSSFEGLEFGEPANDQVQRPQAPSAPPGFMAVPLLTQFNLKPDLYQAAYNMAIRDHEIDKLFNPPEYMI